MPPPQEAVCIRILRNVRDLTCVQCRSGWNACCASVVKHWSGAETLLLLLLSWTCVFTILISTCGRGRKSWNQLYRPGPPREAEASDHLRRDFT
jgi:hypothetical protein